MKFTMKMSPNWPQMVYLIGQTIVSKIVIKIVIKIDRKIDHKIILKITPKF